MIRFLVIRSVALLGLALVSACGAAQNIPEVVYKGEFDNSKIEAVETIVDEVASRWKLRVSRKDRKHMKLMTRGDEAFFVMLRFENDPILILTNVGTANVLQLSAGDYGKMPVEDLNRLTQDMMDSLRKRLNIELRLTES